MPVVVLTSKDLTLEERAKLTGAVEKILQKGDFSRDALVREVKQIIQFRLKGMPNGEAGSAEAAQPSVAGDSDRGEDEGRV